MCVGGYVPRIYSGGAGKVAGRDGTRPSGKQGRTRKVPVVIPLAPPRNDKLAVIAPVTLYQYQGHHHVRNRRRCCSARYHSHPA